MVCLARAKAGNARAARAQGRPGHPRHAPLVRADYRLRRLRFHALGHLVGHPPVHGLRRPLRLDLRLPLARTGPRHGVQDRLDEQRPLRNRLVHGPAGIDPLALEPRPPPQRHDHCRTRPGDRRAPAAELARPVLEILRHQYDLHLLPPRPAPLHRPAHRRRRRPSFRNRSTAKSSSGPASTSSSTRASSALRSTRAASCR